MAVLHLNLTEDHLKLVKFFNIEDIDDDFLSINKKTMLTLQTHLLDDVSLILGLRDKAIKNRTEDADGMAFPDEEEKYMLDTYNYVSDNIHLIETLLHQRCMEGVQPGHYKCNSRDLLWEKVEE